MTADAAPKARLGVGITIGALTAGVALGTVTSLSNVVGSAYSPHAWRPGQGVVALELVAAILGTAWAWALLPFAIGWLVPRWRLAIVAAVVGLVGAVASYYGSDALFGLNDGLSTLELVYWAVLALLVAPLMAVLGWLARRPTRWSVLPGLTAPLLIVLDGATTGPEDIQPWPRLAALAIATLLASAVLYRWVRLVWFSSPTRPGAVPPR